MNRPQERAAALYSLTRELANAVPDPVWVARQVVERAASLVGDGAALWLVTPETSVPAVPAAPAACWHRREDRRALFGHVVGGTRLFHQGPVQDALCSGRSIVLPWPDDREPSESGLVDPEPVDPEHWACLDLCGFSSLALLPLPARGQVLGALCCVTDADSAPLTEADTQFMRALAGAAALGLDNTRLRLEVQERERFGRAVLDSMPLLAAVIDSEGRVVSVNSAWRDHIPSRLAATLGPGDDLLRVCDLAAPASDGHTVTVAEGIRAVLRGRSAVFELDLADDDQTGVTRWFTLRTSPVRGGFGGAVVTYQEITEHVALEQTLRHLAARDR